MKMTERVCSNCHKPFDEPHEFKQCDRCRKIGRETKLKWWHEKRRTAAGPVCSICLKPHDGKYKTCERCLSYKRKFRKEHPEADNEWYLAHRDELLKKSKEYREQTRLMVLTHYSNGETPRCACCNEQNIEFLCIDHINGGGRQHRKQLIKSGITPYLWLVRNDFPEGYRVLCWNCNSSLGLYGYCPHDKVPNCDF